jgi:hypothetical protein
LGTFLFLSAHRCASQATGMVVTRTKGGQRDTTVPPEHHQPYGRNASRSRRARAPTVRSTPCLERLSSSCRPMPDGPCDLEQRVSFSRPIARNCFFSASTGFGSADSRKCEAV